MNKYAAAGLGFFGFLILMITACIGGAEKLEAPVQEQGWILPEGVSEFYLEDGTRCVLLALSHPYGDAGSVTCEWNGMREGGGGTY